MKTWFISDTHSQHISLIIPQDIDTVIHAGDSTNYYDLTANELEFHNFLEWFSNLPIKNKVLIAGNHDAWATKKYNRDLLKGYDIIYLEQEFYELEGKLIFGSPFSPTFGNWHFMRDRAKMYKCWEHLEKGIDILITHTPPKGILDLSFDKKHNLEYCGDSSLLKKVLDINPTYHVFGHIHNSENCLNSGIKKLSNLIDTTFINASVVTDRKFDMGCTSHGNIFDI